MPDDIACGSAWEPATATLAEEMEAVLERVMADE